MHLHHQIAVSTLGLRARQRALIRPVVLRHRLKWERAAFNAFKVLLVLLVTLCASAYYPAVLLLLVHHLHTGPSDLTCDT
jgi:hypothetical protein